MTENLASLDQAEFGALVEQHRRELQVHCYRMMGSFHDAEDMVQETLLRAWSRRDTYAGRASLRAWLYKIATNVCLDALKGRSRRVVPVTFGAAANLSDPIPPGIDEAIWLEPYPDQLLSAAEDDPAAWAAARESITLAFIAALHLLPPRQRAVLILRDVLDWQADEVAALLDTTVSAVKSALHRARTILAERGVAPHADPVPALDDAARSRLLDYVRAWENADPDALASLLKDDAVFSMPPIPSWYQGRATIRDLTARTIFAGTAAGRWRLLPTRANGQIAYVLYRAGESPDVHHAYGIQVLTFDGAQIAEIITFRTPALVARFDLPERISASLDRDGFRSAQHPAVDAR